MSERGFTILELLVATGALSLVLLGMSVFYTVLTRFELENSSQIYLQRQATLVEEEMRRQIEEATAAISGPPAVASTLVMPCPGAGLSADSLQVTNSRGTYCFRRDAAGSDATGLLEDRPDGGGGTWDLLSGAPATLTTTTGACPALVAGACTNPIPTSSGGFCPCLLQDNVGNTVGAAITYRLRFRYPGTNSFQTMTFTTTIAARN